MRKLFCYMLKCLLVIFLCCGVESLVAGPALSESWLNETITGKYVAGGTKASDNTIDLSGGLFMSGDVYIINELPMTADDDYLEIRTSSESFVMPDPAAYGHLIIYTGECCKTVFDVSLDLIFSGHNQVDGAVKKSLTLTFSGPGQVEFKMRDGVQLAFESLINKVAASYPDAWDDVYIDYTYPSAAGTNVYVTMDQSYAQAVEHGQNKVLFSSSEYHVNDAAKITIGRNSFITYLSDNATGLLSEVDPQIGYGSVAFDPTMATQDDKGRMLLHLRGSGFVDLTGTYSGSFYEDGAFVVAGHYVDDLSDPDDIRLSVDLKKPAGVEAIFRVVDTVAWNLDANYQENGELILDSTTGEPVYEASFPPPSRKGLLVVNECKSLPQYAADPYVNNSWAFDTRYPGALSDIRQGFVVGINGCMELYHNTFFDYVGTSTQIINPHEKEFYGSPEEYANFLQYRKKHNPSALLIDGLALLNKNYFDPNDPYKLENLLHYPYVANLELYGGRHAQILLRGDSRIYLRSGSRADGTVDVGADWYMTASELGGYMVGSDRTYSFTINYDASEGSYDGTLLGGYASDGSLTHETLGEGNHVLDVEGKLTVRSTPDNNSTNDSGFVTCKQNTDFGFLGTSYSNGCFFDRHVTTSVDARGAINLPPIKIDFRGREIPDDTSGDLVSRPLTVDSVYPCYNSSSIFLNNEMALHNVNWHHNDVLKDASVDPSSAEPVIVGGEKAYYDFYYWNDLLDADLSGTANTLFVENAVENVNTKAPLISLYTSTLFLHESMVASGVRFVVTDKFLYEPDELDGHVRLIPNISCIMCYNHGDPLDTFVRGYGRSLLLGTDKNVLSDGESTGDQLRSAYLNVYRGWHTFGNSGVLGGGYYPIRLSLETDAQPRYTMQYETRQTNPSSSGSDSFSKLYDDNFLLADNKRVATQVFFLGNNSFVSAGWTTTNADQVIARQDFYPTPDYSTDGSYSYSYGINEGFRPRPWDAEWSLGTRYDVDGTVLATSDFRFSLTSDDNDTAELYISGDNYYFGGKDADGNAPAEPVVTSQDPCVFYANHGGKIHINQDDLSLDENHYYNCFVETVFAYKPWPRILQPSTNTYIDGLSGQVELPHDQVKFARSIQPYNLNFQTMLLSDDQTKENNVRLSVYNDGVYGVAPINRKRASGEEVTIPWNYRTDKSTRIGTQESEPEYSPLKGFVGKNVLAFSDDYKTKSLHGDFYRSTNLAETIGPADMPDAILTVSTGDNIAQMRVSGATKADPFHIYVTGGQSGYGVIREFTSLASDEFMPGEGAHAAIIVDGGGHFGLGSRDWNEHSVNAWSILGNDYVTIYPNGNGFVWVNSNLLVHDRLAIIPTKNFGSYGNEKQVLINQSDDQRLTFYSDVPFEIRVPSGTELDLSAFGFPEAGGGTASSEYPQQIEISGNLRLVFEPGSSLRFPSDPAYQPVLYMNDESQIIFEGVEDRDAASYDSLVQSAPYRTRILGSGQIWLNKNAEMKINDTAHVCVEADDQTLTTSLVISVQRQAGLFIGDENVSGGTFQVGNATDLDSSEIYFRLSMAGREAQLTLQREGFLGLGVGAVNKSGPPNGPGGAWQLQGLYNVTEIAFDISSGVIDHNQIFDGSTRLSSLIGVGPAERYQLNFGDYQEAIIRGGGNIIYVGGAGTVFPSVLGDTVLSSVASDATAARVTGDVNLLMTTGHLIQKGTTFVGAADDFFDYLSMPDIVTFSRTNNPYVALCRIGEQYFSGHVDGTEFVRIENPGSLGETSLEFSLKRGALKTSCQPNGLTTLDRMGNLTVSSV